MQNNFYFLRQLTTELRGVLHETLISECFSQNKDELVLRFETRTNPLFIRATLTSSFSCLSFPESFQRAKKNSVDLFTGVIGYRIKEIRQFTNERSFAIIMEEEKVLLFKMHGNRSNIILFDNGIVQELFRNNIPNDGQIQLEALDRTIDWSFEAFNRQKGKHESLYFTFGKIVWTYLESKGFNQLDEVNQHNLIIQTASMLEVPSYYISRLNDKIHLTLFPLQESRALSPTAVDAINDFYFAFTHEFFLEKEKSDVIALLKSKIKSSQNYYEKNFQKLTEIESDTNYKTWADLIMANMHQLKQGTDKVELDDFYNMGNKVEVKLKKELSPQANAALYYKKAKNQHIEIERIQSSLRAKEVEIENLNNTIKELSIITDLKAFRLRLNALHIRKESEKQTASLPYHEFEHQGFRILVGRNATSNDEMTFRFGFKEDLWLHAKDVAGSHVLIKYQSGKNFPKTVIERAAELAAYNSKRKTESLCPVIVTPKKFVRKRKGDPAGAVIVEREEVVMVTPKL